MTLGQQLAATDLYAHEGMKVLLEEVDALLACGWLLDSRDPEWGTARVYKPIPAVDKQSIGGSLHMAVPSYRAIRPTKRHALSNPTGDQESQLLAEGEANRRLASLTREERQVLLLHSRRHVEVREVQVPVEEVAALLDGGWFLVRQEGGAATLSGEFAVEWTQGEIANLLGASQQSVSRWLRSAYRKLGRT